MVRLTISRYFRNIQVILLLILVYSGMFVSPAFSNSSIQLTWEASLEPDLMGYKVYMGTSPGSHPTINDTGLTSSHLFQNLPDGKTYYFIVTAYDQGGNVSGPSDEVNVEISDTTPPTIPGTVSLTSQSNVEISFTWVPSTDNVSVTSYEITRNGVVLGQSPTNYFIDGGITSGNTYAYTVRALDSGGNTSEWSSPLEVTVESQDTTAPSVPQQLTLDSMSNTQVALTWTAATDNVGVTGYQVARENVVIGQTATTTFADGTASAGTTYSYTVQAMDASGNVSGWSNPLEVTVESQDTTAPSVPQQLTLNSMSNTQVALTWTAATDNVGVTGYQVARDSVALGQTATTTFIDTTTSAGSTYAYTVQAMDASGNVSGWSQPLQATTPQDVVSLTVSTSGKGSVTSSPNGINCPKQNCTANYPLGTVVTLTAAPGKDWSFDGWSGSCTGTALCSITMDSSMTVTANFSKGSQTGTGGGKGNGGGKGRNK
jgi:chitodextrinase